MVKKENKKKANKKTKEEDDKGAAPVLTKMDLTFTEMEIMTKETIATGH